MLLKSTDPGNVMVRPRKPTARRPQNFELVLLDHGLYRELPDQFRRSYACTSYDDANENKGNARSGSYCVDNFSSIRLFIDFLFTFGRPLASDHGP